jgi:hypothetical protein
MSLFTSMERMKAFLRNPNENQLKNDPLYILSEDIINKSRNRSDEDKKLDADFSRAFRLLVEGYRTSNPNKKYYPDANSTLRLTYGKVSPLPADKRNDAKVNYYTTMDGMVKKYKAGDSEFDLPKRLLDMHKAKDYGRYIDKAGYMPVNFLTDNDITGGNSGSPVLNGKGELIGLAFDGNIEAMAGDVIFDTKLQKTINVDIRFVLWVIEKYAGAKHIVDEMTIVGDNAKSFANPINEKDSTIESATNVGSKQPSNTKTIKVGNVKRTIDTQPKKVEKTQAF